jgi:hypothetical protein
MNGNSPFATPVDFSFESASLSVGGSRSGQIGWKDHERGDGLMKGRKGYSRGFGQ